MILPDEKQVAAIDRRFKTYAIIALTVAVVWEATMIIQLHNKMNAIVLETLIKNEKVVERGERAIEGFLNYQRFMRPIRSPEMLHDSLP